MAMQQGRASSRRTTRLACKPFRSLADCGSTPTVVGRGPVVGRTRGELWSRRGFCDFLDAFCKSSTQSIFWSTTKSLPMRHTPLASPGVPKIYTIAAGTCEVAR